jgi:uncharacterized radical SAM superfamily protein
MQRNNHLKKARILSWDRHGKQITFYLPGMFHYYGRRGEYPAISITGSDCALQCDHCMATTLQPMIPALTPDKLIEKALSLAEKGAHGILISGGCDLEGRLPWAHFIPAIRQIKEQTDLFISVHCGILDYGTARNLKDAGIDQALIDVIGDDETYRKIYHVDFGISRILHSMVSLKRAGIPIIPHVVCGLYYGKMRSEKKALEYISTFDVDMVVIVSLMTIPGTPLWGIQSPQAEEVADIIAEARIMMPDAKIGLGCARQRGDIPMEILAIDAGVNRMALPSKEALTHAADYQLELRFQKTCCSVSRDLSKKNW